MKDLKKIVPKDEINYNKQSNDDDDVDVDD